jgi:hypothetical protein
MVVGMRGFGLCGAWAEKRITEITEKERERRERERERDSSA